MVDIVYTQLTKGKTKLANIGCGTGFLWEDKLFLKTGGQLPPVPPEGDNFYVVEFPHGNLLTFSGGKMCTPVRIEIHCDAEEPHNS